MDFWLYWRYFILAIASDSEYRILEVKRLVPGNVNHYEYMGVVRVNLNGTLQEARERFVNSESCFVGNHRFLFMTRNSRMTHPQDEKDNYVRDFYAHVIFVKLLNAAGN